jgi:hypothetical protein
LRGGKALQKKQKQKTSCKVRVGELLMLTKAWLKAKAMYDIRNGKPLYL